MDVAFVDALMRQASDEVGFVPRSRLLRELEAGRIVATFENGEPAGYLWHGPAHAARDLVVHQAVVHYDVRRRLRGAEMVAEVLRRARAAGCRAVRLRCRSSLPANDFWRALGFHCTAVRSGGDRRGADVNEWRLDLWPTALVVAVEPSDRPLDRRAYDRAWRRRQLEAVS